VDAAHTDEAREERTFCRICSAACALVVTVDGQEVVSARGDNDDPVSRGYSCAKGRSVGALHHHPRRLDTPTVRDATGTMRPQSWAACLDDLAARLRSVRDEHGPDAVAIYMATASTFDSVGSRYAARFSAGLGTRNRYSAVTLDSPCKPLVAELMAGRSDLLPAVDRERATFSVFIGVNPVVSHGHFNAFPDPIVRLRELAAGDREVWVIDPRRTETARLATRHLQPRPDTDWVLLAHAIRELLVDGADHDFLADHASGVDRLRDAVAPFDRASVVERTGLEPADVDDLVAALRRHERVAAQTGTGTTMGRAANVTEWLTWALHVVKGSYDRPGGMWFNPGFVGCHDRRKVVPSPEHAVRDTPPPSRPDLPSRMGEYPSAALVDQIESGEVRALVVYGGNPLSSFPEPERLAAAVASLDAVAVIDIVQTETVDVATHVLPSTGQLERADIPYFLDQFLAEVGSRYTPAVVEPGADRLHAWQIFHELGARLDIDVLPDDVDPATVTEDELLARIAARARRPFDELRQSRLIVDEAETFGWVEASLPDGRWRVAPPELVAQLEELAAEPVRTGLLLIPRRQPRHMNSLLRDAGASGRLDDVEVLVHPIDAAGAGLHDGDAVTLRTDHGTMCGVARLDEHLRRGVVSAPHGWPGDAHVGRLLTGTNDCDPLTGMVHQSGVPVTVEPAR
jgi:anaerobic selenocysteine-containing dehydrogenase